MQKKYIVINNKIDPKLIHNKNFLCEEQFFSHSKTCDGVHFQVIVRQLNRIIYTKVWYVQYAGIPDQQHLRQCRR